MKRCVCIILCACKYLVLVSLASQPASQAALCSVWPTNNKQFGKLLDTRSHNKTQPSVCVGGGGWTDQLNLRRETHFINMKQGNLSLKLQFYLGSTWGIGRKRGRRKGELNLRKNRN